MPTPPITSPDQLDPHATYSYADYLTWQFTEWVELIKGKFQRPMAGPSQVHQVVLLNLGSALRNYLKGTPCRVLVAPFDVRLPTGGANGDAQIQTVVQPDLFVVCDRAKLDERGCVGPPDWIIEIVSPGNTARDTRVKFELYQESGVTEYWLVYPGLKTVAAYVLHGERYELAVEVAEPGPVPSHTLPELVLEWADIFADD